MVSGGALGELWGSSRGGLRREKREEEEEEEDEEEEEEEEKERKEKEKKRRKRRRREKKEEKREERRKKREENSAEPSRAEPSQCSEFREPLTEETSLWCRVADKDGVAQWFELDEVTAAGGSFWRASCDLPEDASKVTFFSVEWWLDPKLYELGIPGVRQVRGGPMSLLLGTSRTGRSSSNSSSSSSRDRKSVV